MVCLESGGPAKDETERRELAIVRAEYIFFIVSFLLVRGCADRSMQQREATSIRGDILVVTPK